MFSVVAGCADSDGETIGRADNALIATRSIKVHRAYSVRHDYYYTISFFISKCTYFDHLCGIVVGVSGCRVRGRVFDSRRYYNF